MTLHPSVWRDVGCPPLAHTMFQLHMPASPGDRVRFCLKDSSIDQSIAHHVSGVHGSNLRQRKALVLAEGERRLAVQPLEAPLWIQVLDLTVRTR